MWIAPSDLSTAMLAILIRTANFTKLADGCADIGAPEAEVLLRSLDGIEEAIRGFRDCVFGREDTEIREREWTVKREYHPNVKGKPVI